MPSAEEKQEAHVPRYGQRPREYVSINSIIQHSDIVVLIGRACQDSMGNVARNAREPGRAAAYLAGLRSIDFDLGGTSTGRAAGAGSVNGVRTERAASRCAAHTTRGASNPVSHRIEGEGSVQPGWLD